MSTAWFLSDLGGNPEDGFSHNEAHIIYVGITTVMPLYHLFSLKQDNVIFIACIHKPYVNAYISNLQDDKNLEILPIYHVSSKLVC